MTRLTAARAQRGLTLIELMVALVISSVIVLVVTSFYVTSSRIRASQDAAGQLQDTGRYITEVITKNIQQAGYQDHIWTLNPGASGAARRREVLNGTPDGEPDIRGYNNSATGNPVATGDNGSHDRSDNRVNNSDTLIVRFQGMSSIVTTGTGTATVTTLQPDGTMIDCLGRPQGAPTTTVDRAYSIFEVRQNGAEPELRCKYKNLSTNEYESQVIARGVEVFQVMYGVDLNGDSDPDRWMTGKQVDATPGQWPKVRQVRIGIVLRSLEASNVAPSSGTFTPLGSLFTPAAVDDPGGTFTSPTDSRLRRTVTFTVNLRNAL